MSGATESLQGGSGFGFCQGGHSPVEPWIDFLLAVALGFEGFRVSGFGSQVQG